MQIGEIWNEVSEEIKLEKLRLVTADEKSLHSIIAATENIGKMVASLQSEMIENQALQDVQNEQRVYAKVRGACGPSEHRPLTAVHRLESPVK